MIANIAYTPVGRAVSDFDVEAFVAQVLAETAEASTDPDRRLLYQVSTENAIHAVRKAVAEGRLDHNLVRFSFRHRGITVNRYGAITEWPEGFARLSGDTAEAILVAASARHWAVRRVGPRPPSAGATS